MEGALAGFRGVLYLGIATWRAPATRSPAATGASPGARASLPGVATYLYDRPADRSGCFAMRHATSTPAAVAGLSRANGAPDGGASGRRGQLALALQETLTATVRLRANR